MDDYGILIKGEVMRILNPIEIDLVAGGMRASIGSESLHMTIHHHGHRNTHKTKVTKKAAVSHSTVNSALASPHTLVIVGPGDGDGGGLDGIDGGDGGDGGGDGGYDGGDGGYNGGDGSTGGSDGDVDGIASLENGYGGNYSAQGWDGEYGDGSVLSGDGTTGVVDDYGQNSEIDGNYSTSTDETPDPSSASDLNWTFTYQHEVSASKAYNSIYNDTKGLPTTGMGFNLAALGTAEIEKMGGSATLASELEPYVGGNAYAEIGQSMPDSLESQLGSIEESYHYNLLNSDWQGATGNTLSSSGLPQGTQEALNDFNYWSGSLKSDAPQLWNEVTTGQWQAAINNLEGTQWKDGGTGSGATRRAAEAQLIQADLNAGKL